MPIYDIEGRMKRELVRIESMRPEDKEDVLNFKRQIVAEGLSIYRISKYFMFLRMLSGMLTKPFRQCNKNDMLELVEKIENMKTRKGEPYSFWSKHDLKVTLKRFFKWLKGNDEIYPEEVRWIKSTKKENGMTPDEVLTKDEVIALANHAENLRDKAFILTLYESGCRIGELLPLKLRNIAFDDYGVVLFVSGKTGQRRVRVIECVNQLKQWLDIHPFKNNPDSFVWVFVKKHKDDRIAYSSVCKMLQQAKKRANIHKAVNPHAFRHARATHLAKRLSEAVMKEHFGWTQSSKMASVYNHLSGKDVDDELLRVNGLKPKDKDDVKSIANKKCIKCDTLNTVLTHFCVKCGYPMDLKYAVEVDEQRQQLDEFVRDFIMELAKNDKKVGIVFRRMVKERKLEHMFEDDKDG